MQQLIVGLGNPGEKYSGTRHNVGFALIKKIAEMSNAPGPSRQGQALVTEVNLETCRAVLIQPLTYMNRSGAAVKELLSYFGMPISQLLVIHDDLDLELGRMRFKSHGSAGGHRGVASVIQALGSQDFTRLKIGIGRPELDFSPVYYVLSRFTEPEQKILTSLLEHASEAVKLYLKEGIEAAMNEYNGLDLSNF